MADPNTRQGKRTPVTLKIKFKSETLEQFIERYAVDVSQGGIFIRTKEPLAVGTQMKFEFQLKDASPLIAGEGTVVWTRENDPSRPAIAPGMGVRFDRLADGSQQVLEKILSEKAKQAPQRTTGESVTKPPLFTDTPTRVAPVPSDEPRSRSDSEQTPLPKPMPFQSDAEDFDEKAFEEATKVRALDDLVAETARADAEAGSSALDELAVRRDQRPETPLAEPPTPHQLGDRGTTVPDHDAHESAPNLPSPPTPGLAGRPALRAQNDDPAWATGNKAISGDPGRTRLGVEPASATPAKVTAKNNLADSASARSAVPAPEPAAVTNAPSSAPIIIGVLVVVAAALAAGWYFFIRAPGPEDVDKTAVSKTVASGSDIASGDVASGSMVASGSAVASGSDVASGSMVASGSGVASGSEVGSGSAPPAGPTVDTPIPATTAGATIEVTAGTSATPLTSGKSPLVAKLEKDKPYHVHVSAPGFVAKTVEIKGGDKVPPIKLDAKAHILIVTSDPQGAQIWVDGGNTGKVTPAEIELNTTQAAKQRLHVMLRKASFALSDQVVDPKAYTEEDARMTAKVDARLAVARVEVRPPPNTGSGSAAGSGSAGSGSSEPGSASGSGDGSGSAGASGTPGAAGSAGSGDTVTPPPPTPTPTPTPAPAGAGAGSAGSGSGSGSADMLR